MPATKTATAKPAAAAKITTTARASGAGRANPKAETITPNDKDDVFAQAYARYQEAQESLLQFFATPSWKRTLVAFVSAIVVGYGVGLVAGTLLNWLLIGAVAMAAPTFLVIVTAIIGFLLTVYYGGKLVGRVAGSILTGEADERAIAAYDSVRNALRKLNPFGKVTIEPVRA